MPLCNRRYTPYQMVGIEYGAVWGEGTYGVAAAYARLGNESRAAEVAAGICGLINADGGVLYAANLTTVNPYGDVFYPYPSIVRTSNSFASLLPFFFLFLFLFLIVVLFFFFFALPR